MKWHSLVTGADKPMRGWFSGAPKQITGYVKKSLWLRAGAKLSMLGGATVAETAGHRGAVGFYYPTISSDFTSRQSYSAPHAVIDNGSCRLGAGTAITGQGA